MRALLLTIAMILIAAPATIARQVMTLDRPTAASEPLRPHQIRIEAGANLGLVQELVVTCSNSRSGIVSFSKADRMFCGPKDCSARIETAVRQICLQAPILQSVEHH